MSHGKMREVAHLSEFCIILPNLSGLMQNHDKYRGWKYVCTYISHMATLPLKGKETTKIFIKKNT